MAIVILWLRRLRSWLFLHLPSWRGNFLCLSASLSKVLYGHLKVSSLISWEEVSIETLSTHCYQTHILPAGHSVRVFPLLQTDILLPKFLHILWHSPHPSPPAFWGFHSELSAPSAHYSCGDLSQQITSRLHICKIFRGYFMALRLIESKHHQRISGPFSSSGPADLSSSISFHTTCCHQTPPSPFGCANSFLWACHSSYFLGLSFTILSFCLEHPAFSHPPSPIPLKPSLNPRTGLGGPAVCSCCPNIPNTITVTI